VCGVRMVGGGCGVCGGGGGGGGGGGNIGQLLPLRLRVLKSKILIVEIIVAPDQLGCH